MVNGNGGNGNGVSKLASLLAERGIKMITSEMKKKMGNLLVVTSGHGKIFVLNGGHHLGVEDGAGIPAQEFSQRVPCGVVCVYNPRFKEDGSIDL